MMSVITYFISLLPGLSVWSDAIQGAIIIAAVALKYLYRAFCQEKSTERKGGINLMSEKKYKESSPCQGFVSKTGI